MAVFLESLLQNFVFYKHTPPLCPPFNFKRFFPMWVCGWQKAFQPSSLTEPLQLKKKIHCVNRWLMKALSTFLPHITLELFFLNNPVVGDWWKPSKPSILTSPHPRSYQKLHNVSMCLMEALNSKHHLTLLTLNFPLCG